MSDEQKLRPMNGANLQSANPLNGAYAADPQTGPSADPQNNGKLNGHSGMNGHNGATQLTGGRLTGVCKNWAKGYGFISRNDGQGDVFVHQTQIRKNGFRSLQIGETVEFDIETKEDGRKQAVNVTGPDGVDVIGQERREYGSRGGGSGYPRGGRGGYNQGGFQAAPYGSQPNFGQGYTPFIQQPYGYGQATSGFGQAAPYSQPGQAPAQYGQAPPAQFGAAPSPYGAMAYAQPSSAPQGGDPAKATSPRAQGTKPISSYGQQSGYGQGAYQQPATE